MQARHAGQHRRPGKRRSQPHRPGSPHKGKRKAAKHPIAKRAASKPSQLATLRGLLGRGRGSLAWASLGLVLK